MTPDIDLSLIGCRIYVRWYINDIQVAEAYYDNAAEVPPLEFEPKAQGRYIIRCVVCTCCGCCESSREFIVGSPVSIERQACHVVKFKDFRTWPATYTASMKVQTMDNVVVKDVEIQDYLQVKEDINLTLPGDGVYRVTLSVFNEDGILASEYVFSVYEFCGITECYRKLSLDFLCKKFDVCDDKYKAFGEMRNKLDAFTALAYSFFASVAIQDAYQNGLFLYEEKYLNNYLEHELLLKELKKICGDCGGVILPTYQPSKLSCGCTL